MALKPRMLAAVGIGVLVAVVVAVLILKGPGDAETTIYLKMENGKCVVDVARKPGEVTVGKNHKITWNIENCQGQGEDVAVGNFRADDGSTSPADCKSGRVGTSVPWPFKEDETDWRRRQGKNKIELHTKPSDELAGERLVYLYDICTGANADSKWDPRLVIEE